MHVGEYMMPLRKAGANWVDGDRFFNGEVELEMLAERARDGFHTILTAPRRMASPIEFTCWQIRFTGL